jgi:hypothetical protein
LVSEAGILGNGTRGLVDFALPEARFLYLQLTSQTPLDASEATFRLRAATTQVWPAAQPVQEIADPRFLGTRFQDNALLREEWAPQLLQQAAREAENVVGWGGKKIRDAETWGMPAAQLLMQRALLFFCRTRGATSAHVVDRWANVMERGDYSKPHCHYDADAAVVYSLDIGSENPAAPNDGKFELIDPRVPFCCPSRPERPTRGILPAMQPGTMILFPAEWLHYVKPYNGAQPRITIAWNISAGLPPEEKVIDPTKPVAGIGD